MSKQGLICDPGCETPALICPALRMVREAVAQFVGVSRDFIREVAGCIIETAIPVRPDSNWQRATRTAGEGVAETSVRAEEGQAGTQPGDLQRVARAGERSLCVCARGGVIGEDIDRGTSDACRAVSTL